MAQAASAIFIEVTNVDLKPLIQMLAATPHTVRETVSDKMPD